MAPLIRIFVCMVVFALLQAVAAFNIRIQPHRQLCFWENLKKDQQMSLSFQVAEGGQLDIDFWISNPMNQIINALHRETTGTYNVKADVEGKYTYCFSNQMSSLTEKTVQFAVHGASKPEHVKKDAVDPLILVVDDLTDEIHDIKEEQQYMIARERMHRQIVESSNSRSLWWSLFQGFMLVVVMLVQVYYLKQFFEVKRVV